RMMRLAFLSLFMLFFFFLGLILITMLIIIAFWEQYQLLTIGLIAVLYFILASALAIYLMRQLKGKSRPKLFAASLSEIIKDRIALGAGE
ncbi:MAG TPA: phage holin family protein, partial [Methylophilaceae bacterium]|nr:phage holin family protein [Methylophilaceae bacterium]